MGLCLKALCWRTNNSKFVYECLNVNIYPKVLFEPSAGTPLCREDILMSEIILIKGIL